MSKDKSDKNNARIADRLSAEELAAIRAALEGGEDAEQSQNAVPDGEQPDANGKNRNRDAATEVSERDTDGKETDFTEAGTGVKGNDVGHAKETETNGQNGNGKSVTGKFRNPEELMRAYTELEKEFTRRSQRLAEAERKLKEKDAPFNPDEKEWKETVERFFESTPSAKPFAKDMARELLAHPELREDRNCLNNALTRVLTAKFRTPEQLLDDGEFLNDYVLTSTAVKAAVIEGYLKGLKDGNPPVVLQGAGQFEIAPKKKPASIEEAGRLFLKDNK